MPFIRDGVEAGEPVLVVVGADEDRRACARSSAPTPSACGSPTWPSVGRNPARIIPAWREFVDDHAARAAPVRGIGEPIWPGRSAAELVECQRHEALLNLAFADAPRFWLLCPYDTRRSTRDVIDEAPQPPIPMLREGAASREQRPLRPRRVGGAAARPAARAAAPEPEELPVAAGALARARECVRRRAAAAGLSGASAATTSCWPSPRPPPTASATAAATAMLRVLARAGRAGLRGARRGRLDQPLAGRLPPPRAQAAATGCGWSTQVCDLVQLRAFADGSVVRMHMRV